MVYASLQKLARPCSSRCQFDTCSTRRVSSIAASWVSCRRYEGTGRSLSLKLIQQLRQESSTLDKTEQAAQRGRFGAAVGPRIARGRPARVDPLRPWRPRGAVAELSYCAWTPRYRTSRAAPCPKTATCILLTGFLFWGFWDSREILYVFEVTSVGQRSSPWTCKLTESQYKFHLECKLHLPSAQLMLRQIH